MQYVPEPEALLNRGRLSEDWVLLDTIDKSQNEKKEGE